MQLIVCFSARLVLCEGEPDGLWWALFAARWFPEACMACFGSVSIWEVVFWLSHLVWENRSISIGPDIRQDYPLNLSISISGGKETNKDSPSNGE